MASRGLRSPRFIFFIIFFAASVFLFGGFLGSAFGQKSGEKTTFSPPSAKSGQKSGEERGGARPYLGDHLHWNWNLRGRTVPRGESAAGLRFRAYRQKMAMRASRAAAAANSTPPPMSSSPHPHIAKNAMSGAPAALSGSTAWVPLGPAPLASDATGDGSQGYNWVSGRATSVLIDPADTSGNTVLLGGAYGGLWKSINAGNLSPNPAAVVWQPLIDDQPTLAVGAIALQPGNSNVILVGTGETNNSADSYYGLGILRSADGGSTWTTPPIQSAASGQSFLGIGFSKIAFSTANPSLVVAATAGDNGLCLGLEAAAAGDNSPCLGPEEDGNSTVRGLYYSLNGGATWNRATLTDGAVPASATAVIYNPSQGASGTFYAFIRRHGLYSSTDGQNFTPLTTQPTAGLASALCPASSNATTCLIYRGELAVVPGRNEMYVWVVDVQPDAYGNPTPADEGIWQSTTGGATWTQIPDNGITNCGDSAFGPNSGCGVEQGWYNLELSAIPDPPPPNSTGTDIYAGAINLYKCRLEPGTTTCTQGDWINLTHAYGCSPLAAPAHVHPDQHGIGFMVVGDTTPGYFAHDGGISRTLDGYSGLTTGNCTGTNQFDSLSQTLGSMTEFVSVSVHPTSTDILLGGTQGNGSPKTSTATSSSTWQNALGGDGGFNAINPSNPEEWFAANPYVTIMKCESGPECNDAAFLQVVGSSDLGGDQGAYDTPYILDPQNSSEMLVGTCRVWQIGTSGTAPLQLSNDFDTLGTGLCTGDEINLVNALAAGGPAQDGYSTVVYAVTNGYGPLSGSPGGEIWVTTSAGVSLMTNVTANPTQNVNPNGYAISTVAMDSLDGTGNTAYVGIMGFSTPGFPTSHVWKTANAGASWTDWTGSGSAELPDAPVNALLVDAQAGLVYAGTDVGIFVSATSAPGWTEVGPPPGPGVSGFLPNAPVTALQLFNYAGSKTLVASTYGRGIWNYTLTVDKATPTITWATPSAITYGTALSPTQLNATASVPGTFVYSPVSGTVPGAGSQTLSVTFTPADTTDYNAATATVTLVVNKATPTITWATPSPITYGTALSSTQLNATASVPGTFLYSPVSGTVLGAGSQTLSVSFTPTDTTDYNTATATVTLTVTGAGAAADFTWTDTGSTSVTVLAGQNASYTFAAAPVGGGTFSSAVSFACSGLPALTSGRAGASCAFSPATIAAGAPGTPPVTVTLTITTIGPNLGTQSGPPGGAVLRTAWTVGGGRPYALFLWVVLVGIGGVGRVGVGPKRRANPRLYAGMAGICLGLGLMALISCGGVAGSGSTTIPVTINPPTGVVLFADELGNSWPPAVVQGSNQQQFTANQSVTWAVTGDGNGTIGPATGLYTPPTSVPNQTSQSPVTVTATPATGAAPGSAFLTVAAPTVVGASQVTVTATAAGGASHGDVVTLTVQ